MMNNDQFTSSNGSETQLSSVMEVMISNSNGIVSVVNNPSISVTFEYKLDNLLAYFKTTKDALDFDTKK